MDGQTYYHHHHCGEGGAEALIILGIYYAISNIYQKRKMKNHIKKYLKIVVEFSNIIQDEKNILQDMIKARFPFKDINEQQIYVNKLCSKQRNAIVDLKNVESQYPGEINNRFFYFENKPIYV